MGGGRSAAGARQDHEAGGRSIDERQLRLVPHEEPRADLPSVAQEHPHVQEDTCNGTVVSLAAYVLSLTEGSSCFCCGEPLVAADPAGAGAGGRAELICVVCGAEVEREVHS